MGSSNFGLVLIAAPVHQMLINGLAEAGYECLLLPKIDQQTAYNVLPNCVGVITSTRLLLDAKLLAASPKLRWIGRLGSGMEIIDVDFASSRGIQCFSSPEGNCNAVGEHALGMLLSLTKKITSSHQEVQAGIWLRDENRGIELEGRTIGIIGFGHTGRAFAKKLAGFDVHIVAYDKYSLTNTPSYVQPAKQLAEVFQSADVVSFHTPLTPETVGYFDDAFVDSMHKPFILVNTSRGKVVSLPALHRGLLSGKVAGACLDVFEEEPIATLDAPIKLLMDDMVTMPNVVVTPHIAGYSFEAQYKMSNVLLGKVLSAKG
jgi:D-3-phosphoglycerate dehydrogenase / 2-oxoglutarate reductase